MRIISWNVNGLRASVRKGFIPWLESCGADVVAIQEVRCQEAQLPVEVQELEGWHLELVSAQRKGYSGVAVFSRKPPDAVEVGLGVEEFDVEGRLQLLRFGALWVVNGYFPNGNGPNRDLSRIPYKLRFYRSLFDHLETLRHGGGRVLVMGDFNTAHEDIDLARPKQNRKTSGFRPEERAELDRWITAGWVDTFRHVEPGPGHYSWWSQRKGVRARNIGWRIDYILASSGVMPWLDSAAIHPEVEGSDHCPISVTLLPDASASDAATPSQSRATVAEETIAGSATSSDGDPSVPLKPKVIAGGP